jgi:lipid A disaccharide synthetase
MKSYNVLKKHIYSDDILTHLEKLKKLDNIRKQTVKNIIIEHPKQYISIFEDFFDFVFPIISKELKRRGVLTEV